MKVIENQTFDMERALYGSEELLVQNCSFDGPADGESAFKEGRNIKAAHCFFNLRYRSFLHGNTAIFVIAKLYNQCVVRNVYNDSVKTAAGKHTVAYLKRW